MSFKLREFVPSAPPQSAASPVTMVASLFPPEATSIAETGLSIGFLTDLVLKVIYFSGNITAQRLSEVTKLPFLNVLDKVLDFLKLEEYVDITGAEGSFSERSFQYVIATKGRVKVAEILDRTQYAGPAPVPLDDYIAMVHRQSIGGMVINTDRIREAFSHLVISEQMLDKVGPAGELGALAVFVWATWQWQDDHCGRHREHS